MVPSKVGMKKRLFENVVLPQASWRLVLIIHGSRTNFNNFIIAEIKENSLKVWFQSQILIYVHVSIHGEIILWGGWKWCINTQSTANTRKVVSVFRQFNEDNFSICQLRKIQEVFERRSSLWQGPWIQCHKMPDFKNWGSSLDF